ncbi:hypothetical protein [Occallatibacter savannae]|uniref:hypothetical protein n=1 Tax=Occallatibacter savannae TaxID=1002691 RepID=UPI0013A56268|nr:hypothetical protein [Occallatibacter savannae]
MRSKTGCLAGCLSRLVLWGVIAVAFVYVFTIALNPWALHIGGRSTPLLWWHGAGSVLAKDGRSYPLYISFWPGRPRGSHGGGRREGKTTSARLQGNAWLCTAPGQLRRLTLSGTMYGGYTSTDSSLFDFRLIDYTPPFSVRRPNRGFFDLAGSFRGQQLLLDRPGEQGIPFDNSLFVDHATATLDWSAWDAFRAACNVNAR